MSDPEILKITNGLLGLALVDTSAVGYSALWQAPDGAAVDEVVIGDYASASAGFACQLTTGIITASPNVATTTREATWCAPSKQESETGETSFGLDLGFYQDAHKVNGFSRFLFENDTREAYVFVGMAGTDPPRAIGRVQLSAAAIGGAGRTNLTAQVSLPFSNKPSIEFGDGTTSVIVNSGALKAAAAPGDAFDTEPTITASDATNAAKLAGLGYIANPLTAWTVGQVMTVGGFEFNWSGTAWDFGAA